MAVGVTLFATLSACGRSVPSVITFPIDGHPSAVTVAGGFVWVADDGNHSVHTFDAKTGKEVGRPIEVSRNPIALSAGGGSVWVAHASGRVMPIEIRSRRAGRAIKVGGSLTGIDYDGLVWVTDLEHDDLVSIEPGERKVTDRIRIPDGAVRVAADGDLWTTNRENTVTRVAQGAVEDVIGVGMGPIGLAGSATTLWVANSDDATVSAIDIRTSKASEPIPVGRAPVAVVLTDDIVWVANQEDATLTRIDPEARTPIGEPIDVGVHPRGLATDGTSIWVVGTNPEGVVRVDP